MRKFLLLILLIVVAGCTHKEVRLSEIPYGKKAGVVITFDTEITDAKKIEYVADILKKHNVNATFFVVAGYFNSYEPLEPLGEFEVASMGWNQSRWKEHKMEPVEQIDQIIKANNWLGAHFKVRGFRAPYLLPTRTSFRAIASLGYIYDSSICCGFHPYYIDGIVEIPLSINYDPFWSEEKMKIATLPTYLLLEQAIEERGYFTFSTHIDRVYEQQENFTRFLEYASARDVWFATCSEVADWWRKYSNLSLEVYDDKAIVRNLGPEKVEGATLIIENGEVRYIVLPEIQPYSRVEVELE